VETRTDVSASSANPRSAARVRCLLGMMGVDCHSKGLRTLARLLRDRGVEVIYVGEHNTADGLAEAAATEDVDVVGVSFSTSTYLHHSAELVSAMRRAGVADIPVMIGGLIHSDHEEELARIGVARVFGPGSTTDEIMDFLNGLPGVAHTAAT
jgi:methylmalonyl-CoA mutase C-terminal domain/subunit